MINFLLNNGLIPDILIRWKIRKLIKMREKELSFLSSEIDYKKNFYEKLSSCAIAIKTDMANEQHYEVPAEFYQLCLGPNLKYSCALFETNENLKDAENKMLQETVKMAQIKDGDKILELGCGWGSITLFLAKNFPNSKITAISNSKSQKTFIDKKAKERGLNNIEIITSDINAFETDEKFDRVISVEMFEHVRNHQLLLQKINSWLKKSGTLFVHIFVHDKTPYLFDVKDDSDWMSKYFFSGGMMPSFDIFNFHKTHFNLIESKKINGLNYSKTAEHWLKNTDNHKNEIMKIFKKTYNTEASKWFEYWRIFFMSCSELWKYQNGNQWYVAHYLLEKRNDS